MNQMEKAFAKIGIVNKKKANRRNNRKWTCRKCGKEMSVVEGTNVLACESCGNYFLFERK